MEALGPEVAAGLHRLGIALPYPTKPVNAYIGRHGAGWAVVDTGVHDEATERLWSGVLDSLDGPLTAVYATHYHPDHLGMAGWLSARTGAPVHMMAKELDWAKFMWAEGMPQGVAMAELCRRHGMPPDLAEAVRQGMVRQRPDTLPLPDEAVAVQEDDEIELGGVAYRVLYTPGHSDGLYCLWDAAGGVFVSGDLVLPTITPNVAVWPGAEPNPLGRFLDSLRRARDLKPRVFLPGHGEPFSGDERRVERILDHHEQRLSGMLQAVGAGTTAWQICEGTFGERLSPHQLRFAMAETLAHLDLLERRGALHATGGEPVRYVP